MGILFKKNTLVFLYYLRNVIDITFSLFFFREQTIFGLWGNGYKFKNTSISLKTLLYFFFYFLGNGFWTLETIWKLSVSLGSLLIFTLKSVTTILLEEAYNISYFIFKEMAFVFLEIECKFGNFLGISFKKYY